MVQVEIDIRACLMAKRGVEEENVNTCMVHVGPAPKAARQQVAVASRGRVSYCSTVHNVANSFELLDKGMCWKIAEAIGHWDCLLRSGHWTSAQLGLFAEEVSNRGARRFFTNTYMSFGRDMAEREPGSNFYEVIQEGQPCWLYFDMEFSKIVNPQLDADEVMGQFRRGLKGFCAKEGVQYDDSRTVVLDSSTESKFSKHVIVKSLAFENNIRAGWFVHMFVEHLRVLRQERGPDSELLFVRGDSQEAEARKTGRRHWCVYAESQLSGSPLV